MKHLVILAILLTSGCEDRTPPGPGECVVTPQNDCQPDLGQRADMVPLVSSDEGVDSFVKPTGPCFPEPNIDCDSDGVTPAQGDCDDYDATSSPLLSEDAAHGNIDDHRDNDCDGTVDEWSTATDSDGDRVPDYSDCDPHDPTRWTGAPEICNDGIDSDCDGSDNMSFRGGCTETVGTIDALVDENNIVRVTIAGIVSKGLIEHPQGTITTVSIGSDTNENDGALAWRGDAPGVWYEFHIPNVAFTPRVNATSIVNFDLRKWLQSGAINRVPSKTERGGIILAVPKERK